MFIHSVYYWLHNDLPPEQVAQFEQGLRSLAGIESVRHGYVCTCAPTRRPVIDSTYSYALIVLFQDQDAHDRYQVDPVHEEFRRAYSSCFHRAVVYDCIE